MIDAETVIPRYREQDEFACVEHFLDDATIAMLVHEANAARPLINRNYVPRIKKGGSVSYFDVSRVAPQVHALYHSRELIAWLSRVTGEALLTCPETDPHACALYYYTEAGDHIGYHFDTSFYRGKRFTVLVGLVERSSSELVCQLYHNDKQRETVELRVKTEPGTLVVFNGDTLWHCVTPSKEGDDRVVALRRAAFTDADGHDSQGEWVGFAKLSSTTAAQFRHAAGRQVASGATGGGYEDALAGLLTFVHFTCVPTNDAPWMEIDFPADLARARQLFA